MTEEMIRNLEDKGFRRWPKNGMDRLYVNADKLGLDSERGLFRGEKISNAYASELRTAKTYIDIIHGEIRSDKWQLAAAIAEMLGVEYEGTPTIIRF